MAFADGPRRPLPGFERKLVWLRHPRVSSGRGPSQTPPMIHDAFRRLTEIRSREYYFSTSDREEFDELKGECREVHHDGF